MKNIFKQIPICLLIFWIISTLLLNKDIDMLSVNVLSLPFRHTHVILILLIFSSIKDLNISLFKKNTIFFLLNLVGLIVLAKSLNNNLRLVLGSFGLYLFSLFYIFTYLNFSTRINILLIIKTIIIFCVLGNLAFILKYLFLNHYTLPIGIHLSSDVLPIVSATSIFLIWGFQLNKIKFYQYAVYFFIASIVLVKIKGVMLAMAIAYLFYRLNFKKHIIIALSILIICFVTSKCLLPRDFFNYVFYEIRKLNFLDGGQTLNVGSRLLVWDEVTNKIRENFFFGSGIIPLNCPSFDYFWPNVVGISSKNVNPHNSYLLMTFYGGFLFLLLFLKLIFDLKWSLLNSSKEFLGIFSGVIIIMVCALTTPVFELYYLAPFFWIYLALLKIYSENSYIIENN
jgi:hypothetical protein